MPASVTATCPRCGANVPMLPIVFGLPTSETFQAARRGEVALGGCIVTGEDPTHECSACGEAVILDPDPIVVCVVCGRPLLGDPEDDPDADDGRSLCGECNRERNFAAVEELSIASSDGEHTDRDSDFDGDQCALMSSGA